MACPVCGARLQRTTVRLSEPFRCTACGVELECARGYGARRAAVGIALGAVSAELLHVGWPLFPLAALATCIILARPIMSLSLRYFPPRLRRRVGPGLGLGGRAQ